MAAGLALGILLAYLRSLPIRWLPLMISTLVDILRAIPPLVLIILLYFALPFLGLSLGAFASTWLALTLVLAAFSEEVFWAGIELQPRGVMEAARSTGLTHTQSMVYVLLPQSCRLMVAPLAGAPPGRCPAGRRAAWGVPLGVWRGPVSWVVGGRTAHAGPLPGPTRRFLISGRVERVR